MAAVTTGPRTRLRLRPQGVLLILCGAALLRIALFSELYLRYVKEGLRPYLVISGVALIALGLVGMISRGQEEDEHEYEQEHEYEVHDEDAHEAHAGHGQDTHAGHGHDHTRNPRIAWLLTAPALALLLFPPPALGSYSAGREEARVAAQGTGTFPELPAGDPVDLTLGAFASRAEWDTGASMKNRTVRLTGFVTRDDDGTWYIARLLVTCCAADAQALKVQIRDADAPPADAWVTVTGTWHPTGKPGSAAARPVLDAASVKRVSAPSDPYEKR
ncbi:TIGR03943 family putative permease subunit [Streptomyces phaeochromogenes]|uniref:TIGR03943 family putative permease subunit n=1 Tax=Streptomyces phaeochromogenes TaxID=1923 RepID=UPI002DDC817F|nr:TIGR03943 family protein [Streptomyces phaeochromogenes]WRZ31006.1 TIGR03943 family protein [Streptomyces phaeochromogenes]